MAPPTLVRTWQFAVNRVMPDLGAGTPNATNRRLLRTIKNMLIGADGLTWTDKDGSTVTPSGHWTVVASSDSSTAGHDAVDRWAADANLVWATAGSAHSWIVLQQTGIGATFQILIDCDATSSNSHDCDITVSHSGFGVAGGGANGTTTAAPTALNSIVLVSGASAPDCWGGYTGGSPQQRIHMMRSADGKGMRLLITRDGFLGSLWLIDLAGNPETGWTQPYLAVIRSNATVTLTSDRPILSDLSASGVTAVKSASTAGAYGGTLSVEGPAGTSGPEFFTIANSYSGNLPMFPVGFMSNAASHVGRHGILPDFWLSLANQVGGGGYPGSAPLNQFVQVGKNFILPWNKSVPNFTGI